MPVFPFMNDNQVISDSAQQFQAYSTGRRPIRCVRQMFFTAEGPMHTTYSTDRALAAS